MNKYCNNYKNKQVILEIGQLVNNGSKYVSKTNYLKIEYNNCKWQLNKITNNNNKKYIFSLEDIK